jgi:hypothetical protein
MKRHSTKKQPSLLLSILFCLFFTPLVLEAQITGSVFRDYNGNGTKETNEPLVSGITVTAYGSSGAVCGMATTSGSTTPNYSLTGCGTAAVRVEFSIATSGSCAQSGVDFTALGGSTYGSSVQFKTGNATNVNFAINNPNDYNTGTTGINAFIPCYVGGNPLGGGNSGSSDWFVGFPYTNSGTTAPTQKMDGTVIGSVWGVAYSKQAQKIFTSAFLKRHTGLGTLGSGGIYMLTPTANSFSATAFYNMDANGYRTRAASSAMPYGDNSSFIINGAGTIATFQGATDAASGAPIGLGVIGNNGGGAAGTDRGLSATRTDPSNDPAAFDQVGKVGLGGLEISDDGKFLFVINLFDRKVYRLELNDAYNPSAVIAVTAYSLPSVTVTNGVLRPFGNKFHQGKLYVGAVTTGENNGQNIVNGATDLYAYVFQLEAATGAASFNSTPTITYPLNYLKGEVEYIDGTGSDFEGARWLPWTNSTASALENSSWIVYPSPMLTDIDFTEKGDLVMAFTDRGGHQWGTYNYKNLTGTPTALFEVGGDILIAGKNCSTGVYSLESNGAYSSDGQTLTSSSGGVGNNEGPNGGEFFNNEKYDPYHYETVQGAVATLPGQAAILTTVMDPTTIFEGGTVLFSTKNGTASNQYQLYVGNNTGDNGKANGLGDIELSKIESPIEIGNRVWNDGDRDGYQDAGEAGIGSLTIYLYEGTTHVGTTTTDANGNYYFNAANVNLNGASGLKPHSTYQIRIAFAQPPLSNLGLTTVNVGSNASDLIDNDATSSGTNAIIDITLANAGENNHTLDFGFSCIPPTITSVAFDTAKCVNGVMNSNAWVAVRGISGMAKYAYATNGTSGLFANTATASTADSIRLSNIANPSVSTTYTFRIWGADTTCYNDTTVVLPPSVCPPCSITGAFMQNSCNNNGTTVTDADDYFTVTVSAVSATNGGTSGKYEVVLMPAGTVLNTGGTNYGASVMVGGAGVFSANGTTTYMLKVRDLDISGCESTVFTTTATAACSTISCLPQICVPVTITRN